MNINSQDMWFLRRAPEGPLVKYINPFVSYLAEQGFCRRYMGLQCRISANFSKWLLKNNISIHKVTEEHIVQFAKETNYQRAVNRGEVATLHRLFNFLKQREVIQQVDNLIPHTPIQQTLYSFGSYILNEKGLSNNTLIQYSPFVKNFLVQRFGRKAIELSKLSAKDIVDFIKDQASHLSVVRAKVAVSAMRAFLRYAAFHGDIDASLINAVPTVAAWSISSIPKAISPDHIQAVLAHCPRDSQIGKRDYAVLMLLVHLGLRSGEIVGLTLDSINWEDASITVNGKGGQEHCLPLPAEVGKSIADYLLHGRPKCKERALFIRALAPFKGLGAQQTIGTIVNMAIKRAGVDTPSRGAHQFRHAVASKLLRHGGNLKEIGSILGHQHPKTTNIYAKVDLINLRSLSMPWPGGV